MSDKIVSSLTDRDLITYQSYRQVANAAVQQAIEEYKIIAREREQKLIEAAILFGAYFVPVAVESVAKNVITYVYGQAGLEELQ